MKELSIEQKAKAYDEAIERANVKLTNEVAEDIFPELKESEDEKIREEILTAFSSGHDNSDIYGHGITYGQVRAWLEKQGEQKLAKVEPKINVGDWVVNNNGEPQLFQVISRSWPDSKIKRATNNLEIFINTATLDKQYHLWTIQDAKDGDVLAAHECYVIFKEIDGLNIKCYCTYHYMGCNPSFYVDTLQNKNAFHPATKEQRDFLSQKMREARYEWDAEKKELKKIDNEEVNGEDYGIDSLYHAQRILEKTLGSVDGYQSDDGILEHKCAISAVKKLYEQKPAEWSKEDEEIHRKCICAMRASACGFPEEEKFVEQVDNWLKSLKDRMQPQPEQEWSKEDEKHSLYICAALDCYYRLREDRNNTNGQENLDKARNWLLNKLKSLRPQSQWKPSDEQMVVLNDIIINGHLSNANERILKGLQEQLKKLQE